MKRRKQGHGRWKRQKLIVVFHPIDRSQGDNPWLWSKYIVCAFSSPSSYCRAAVLPTWLCSIPSPRRFDTGWGIFSGRDDVPMSIHEYWVLGRYECESSMSALRCDTFLQLAAVGLVILYHCLDEKCKRRMGYLIYLLQNRTMSGWGWGSRLDVSCLDLFKDPVSLNSPLQTWRDTYLRQSDHVVNTGNGDRFGVLVFDSLTLLVENDYIMWRYFLYRRKAICCMSTELDDVPRPRYLSLDEWGIKAH